MGRRHSKKEKQDTQNKGQKGDMTMKWEYVKKLKSVDLIDEFERLAKYKFCESFRRFVIENNGGMPEKNVFDTDCEERHVFDILLSFNKEDISNIWSTFENFEWLDEDLNPKDELRYRYIAFAEDPFGNLICFDSTDDKVVFVDHEDLFVEIIADGFDGFLEALYDPKEG